MSAAAGLQTLLRFLSQDAKVPLATAIGKAKELQTADLDKVDSLAKASIDDIRSIFTDDKIAKQIQSAARRVSKKRAAGGEDSKTSPKKQRKETGGLFSVDEKTPVEIEEALTLPTSDAKCEELEAVTLITNRAPLVLAMAVTLLKYTMSHQPLSSRLSLAQAYVGVSSRSKAVSIGLESGKSAEEEGFGEGQPIITVMGRNLRVLKRWGYEWRQAPPSTQETLKADDDVKEQQEVSGEEPAVWALDLEALKKSNRSIPADANIARGSQSGLPIYTPQSARAYLLKSFESASTPGGAVAITPQKKLSAAEKIAGKERNLGLLLRALDLLFESWADTLDASELDRRANGWYFKIRPQVESGVAGWGGRNELKLANILALRRTP
ncbi:hypothetical protein K431DRAFT_216397 [Polychaeton citri CBS 116435]|uniref:Impact N-terminal domain-containing protein n=1 Tax=Polychaeton citri CBS 116435 TaxID=1314669 RepID=A0A9P4QHQ6_9PEZI|nr:hypothetical protein K431DRAFT_216397 [Polychaeton citri CBS 116435]